MRKLGFVLMWVGFLTAAFITVRQADRVTWPIYIGFALVGAAGVYLLRRTSRPGARHASVVQENLGSLITLLKRLNERITVMNRDRERIFVYDVHDRIDAEMAEDLAAFADRREAMIHGLGLAEYATVMDDFARAERQLHRAWSASADGYVDEVWSCMGQAETLLASTLQKLEEFLRTRGTAAARA